MPEVHFDESYQANRRNLNRLVRDRIAKIAPRPERRKIIGLIGKRKFGDLREPGSTNRYIGCGTRAKLKKAFLFHGVAMRADLTANGA